MTAYRCPACRAVSGNPHDFEQAYCGACHQFAVDVFPRLLALGDGTYSQLSLVDGKVCGISRFLLTWGLLVGMSIDTPYERRYCYEDEAQARVALALWDGSEHPSGPWVKVKGRMGDRWLDELGPGALARD